MNRPIGVFDSGIGGLSVLKAMKDLMPGEYFIYYADSLHNPYGSKNGDELLEITSNIVDYLLDKDCKIIVIACNTATTVCREELMNKYKDVVFVGVVPAIKMAYDNDSKNTLVLATPYTVRSKRMDELVTTYKHNDQKITLVPCLDLAHTVEHGDEGDIARILDRELREYREQTFDMVILGCTHYSIIKEMIKSYYPNSKIIDGNLGVAREVKHQLELANQLNDGEVGKIEFVNSDKDFKLDLEEVLNNIK